MSRPMKAGLFAHLKLPCGVHFVRAFVFVHEIRPCHVSVSVPSYNGRSCGLREVFILFSCSRLCSYDKFSYRSVVTTTHSGNPCLYVLLFWLPSVSFSILSSPFLFVFGLFFSLDILRSSSHALQSVNAFLPLILFISNPSRICTDTAFFNI